MGNFQIPDPPLIAAGACGGPAVVYLVTPLRNALTLGSNNTKASAMQLYKQVFVGEHGLKGCFAGGLPMARAAVPGFLVLGPAFHMYKDALGGSSVGAVLLTAVSESLIFFAPEVNNAQLTYNQNAKQRSQTQISKIHSPWNPLGCGVGFGLHFTRNVLAMSGLRVFSEPCQTLISQAAPNLSSTSTIVWGDFIANVIVSAASAPIHQLFGWAVTTRVAMPQSQQQNFSKSAIAFLKRQYLTESGRISSVAGRDMFLRIAYNASIFTLYGFIERTLVQTWPESLQLWGTSSHHAHNKQHDTKGTNPS